MVQRKVGAPTYKHIWIFSLTYISMLFYLLPIFSDIIVLPLNIWVSNTHADQVKGLFVQLMQSKNDELGIVYFGATGKFFHGKYCET